ncbi:MAG: ABC transporter ATP-binding protein [Heliobacteriaceae bacterium]|nr:ABC transporter ATP-binding protein [Heliobacteriaceae bacterium]MDD4587088.1 ABC transporter ATP-binding protein [Heliobacteriaceae bacterium]
MSFVVESLCFNYPGQPNLLNGISFSVAKGDVLCLLGPNGTGKTTLLRCLLGINKMKQGKIRIGGRDSTSLTPKELARAVAYVPQATTSVFPYEVLDMVLMGRNPHLKAIATPTPRDKEIAQAALADVGISHLAKKPFSEISGGERQLVLIARALAQQSAWLIMDEPTASLDYGNQTRILKIINELARAEFAIIMTSHFPNHAFLACNKVAIMKGGKILAIGNPDEIVTDTSLSDLYAARIKVVSAQIREKPRQEIKVCVPLLA